MPTAPAPKVPFDTREELPLLAMHDAVVFPGTLMQILLRDAPLAQHLSSHAGPDGATVAIFVGKAVGTPGEPLGEVSEMAKSDLAEVGVVAQVVSVAKGRGEGALVVVLRGFGSARSSRRSPRRVPSAKARVAVAPEVETADEELDALVLNLRHAVHEVMDQLRLPEEMSWRRRSTRSPPPASSPTSSPPAWTFLVAEKLEILSTLDVKAFACCWSRPRRCVAARS